MLEGLDWLQNKGYRTVVYLRRADEDDASDSREVSKRGMKYIGLKVTLPLTPEVVNQVNQIVADPENSPLFVYDVDGSLAGGLWYIYFRTIEGASEAVAAEKADQLGLKRGPEAHQQMWAAIEEYLKNR